MADEDNKESTHPTQLEFDANILGEEQYNDIIHDAIGPLADVNPLKIENGAAKNSNYSGLLQLHAFGGLTYFRLRGENMIYTRSRKHIASSDTDDFYIVAALGSGTNNVSTERQYTTNRGDCIILDLAHPLAGHCFSKVDNSQVVLPKQALQQHGFSMNPGEGLLLPGSAPGGAMLSSAIISLGASLKNATPQQAMSAANRLPGLISHLMAPQEFSADSPEVRSVTLAAMMEYIERNLSDPNLGVTTLFKAFHTSRSAVYRLFAAEGGVAAYILRRRLHACYLELALNPSRAKRIIDIAVKWGFNNHSHFTRIFHKAYGLTPSSLLEAALAHELESVNQQEKVYSDNINKKKQWILNNH